MKFRDRIFSCILHNSFTYLFHFQQLVVAEAELPQLGFVAKHYPNKNTLYALLGS